MTLQHLSHLSRNNQLPSIPTHSAMATHTISLHRNLPLNFLLHADGWTGLYEPKSAFQPIRKQAENEIPQLMAFRTDGLCQFTQACDSLGDRQTKANTVSSLKLYVCQQYPVG